MSEELAVCRVCGGKLRHAPIVMDAEDGHSFVVPSYHADCIKKERQSGGRWQRK